MMLCTWLVLGAVSLENQRNESLESNEKKNFYLQKKVVFKVLGILRDEDKNFWDGSQFTNQFSLLSCNQNTLKDSYKEEGLIWAHDYGAQAVVACMGDRSGRNVWWRRLFPHRMVNGKGRGGCLPPFGDLQYDLQRYPNLPVPYFFRSGLI